MTFKNVVLTEFALLLWRKRGTWQRTLADVAIANIVSTVIGIGIISMLPNSSRWLQRDCVEVDASQRV